MKIWWCMMHCFLNQYKNKGVLLGWQVEASTTLHVRLLLCSPYTFEYLSLWISWSLEVFNISYHAEYSAFYTDTVISWLGSWTAILFTAYHSQHTTRVLQSKNTLSIQSNIVKIWWFLLWSSDCGGWVGLWAMKVFFWAF